ncbi:MAG: hypothetical protein LAP39_00305 [Acidobacteriia bacterium]|nr:hypothetical protein [Terriglobia bacterium]
MALFTDASISTLDQIALQDTGVLDVASTEGIDAAAKIALAQEELGVEMASAISRSAFSRTTPSSWWPGSVGTSLTSLTLTNIAVTPPLRLWHTFHTLELIYRDAYGTQLNDRYLSKWKEYQDLSKWASIMLLQTGIGVVLNPIVIADSPEIDLLSGSLPATTYYVQVAWLNASGEEGMASPVASINAPDHNSVQVKPKKPPTNAASWNLYAGTAVDSIMLQNASPVNVDQIWTMPPSGLAQGCNPGQGQEPNYFSQLPRFLQRG